MSCLCNSFSKSIDCQRNEHVAWFYSLSVDAFPPRILQLWSILKVDCLWYYTVHQRSGFDRSLYKKLTVYCSTFFLKCNFNINYVFVDCTYNIWHPSGLQHSAMLIYLDRYIKIDIIGLTIPEFIVAYIVEWSNKYNLFVWTTWHSLNINSLM